MTIQETFFWKHLSDALLDEMGIEREGFYSSIDPLRGEWQEEVKGWPPEQFGEMLNKRTETIRQEFREKIIQHKTNMIDLRDDHDNNPPSGASTKSN